MDVIDVDDTSRHQRLLQTPSDLRDRERVEGAYEGGPRTSLEEIIQAEKSFSLNPKSSWTSSKARVHLPVSRSSSIASTGVPSRAYGDATFENRSRAESQVSKNSAGSRSRTRVRIDEGRNHPDDHASLHKYSAFVEDEEDLEPTPLWYKSQTFSHRYGSSTRREPLLNVPLRSSTFPTELPSRNVRLADESSRGPIRRTSILEPTVPLSGGPDPAERTTRSLLRPARRLLGLHTPGNGGDLDADPIEASNHPGAENIAHESPTDGADNDENNLELVYFERDPTQTNGDDSTEMGQGALNIDLHATAIGKRLQADKESEAIRSRLDHDSDVVHGDIRPGNILLYNPTQASVRESRDQPPANVPLISYLEPSVAPKGNDDENAWVRRRRTGDINETAPHRDRNRITVPSDARRSVVPRPVRIRESRVPSPPNVLHHNYGNLVDQLSAHMPQLINVRGKDSREYNSGNIYCYDSLESGGLPRLYDHIWIRQVSRGLSRRIRALKPDRVRNVRFRYILVEDLSPRVIEHLGSTFWLNPEFFEEHLNRSGYRAESYNDPAPWTWNTNATPKDYVSVRWFRPVQRARIKPLSEHERNALLMRDGSTGTLNWLSSSDEGRFDNTVRLTTNIFRKEWPIVSDPDRAFLENEEGTFPVAWEEKVTIQVSQTAGRPPTFLILLDPLPTLSLKSEALPKTKKGLVAQSNLVREDNIYSMLLRPSLSMVRLLLITYLRYRSCRLTAELRWVRSWVSLTFSMADRSMRELSACWAQTWLARTALEKI